MCTKKRKPWDVLTKPKEESSTVEVEAGTKTRMTATQYKLVEGRGEILRKEQGGKWNGPPAHDSRETLAQVLLRVQLRVSQQKPVILK